MNREEWLNEAIKEMRNSIFSSIPLPDQLRVTCGWPSRDATSRSRRSIGQCHTKKISKDQTNEICISPFLDDPIEVLDCLCHELIHASDDCKSGHRGLFIQRMRQVGLEGKPTSTKASEPLRTKLIGLSIRIGEYPHASLNLFEEDRKKDKTRMIKLVCPSCNYTVRTTQKWIETGLPICHCGASFEIANGVKSDE